MEFDKETSTLQAEFKNLVLCSFLQIQRSKVKK